MSDTRDNDADTEEQAMHERQDTDYMDIDELPPRPRTRLLTPATVLLMLVLFAACGFVGGVLVEKHQNSGSSLAGLAAARTGATGATGAGGGFAGRLSGLFGGGASSRGTIGTVSNINGRSLYVTTAAGTMVEVKLTSQSKVTKSQSVGSNAIRPGDSVVVSGITASDGTVTASAVTDSGTGGATGIASLFGAGGGTSAGATSSGGGGVSLFGG